MKVSIIITCYNRERYVGRAIRSAVSQRFPRDEFEVIVVDDGSTDHSPDVIRDFGDQVKAIFHRENQGLPSARNTGIRAAGGRFVVHLDSDDYIHEDLIHVEYLHLAMNPDWGAVGCDYFCVDDDERHLDRKSGAQEPIACGIMFRKEHLVEVGLYDPEMRMWEDEELRHRYEERHAIGHVQLPLYRYRRHDGNLTNDVHAAAHYREKLEAKRPRTSSE